MKRIPEVLLCLLIAGCASASTTTGSTVTSAATTAAQTTTLATATTTTGDAGETVEFARARLRVEINATDGDAGLQIDLDHDAWKRLSLTAPDGTKLVDVVNQSVLESYGLTELFSESSEPPFTEFPLEEFMALFPEGDYLFEGETIEGVQMRSVYTLTHDFPEGPEIVSPEEDATVGADDLVVEWTPVTEPAGIEIVRYQVLVINESDDRFAFSAVLPADATSISVPAEFLAVDGEYKVEVLAIETSGNQTLNEVTFTVG